MLCRYPQRTELRGCAEHIFGVGVSIWYFHLLECLKHTEYAFELNKQVNIITHIITLIILEYRRIVLILVFTFIVGRK